MSQRTDSMIKLALVFFVSLLSFSIGTYVGKKYSDNQHKLSLLEPKAEATAVAHTRTAGETMPEAMTGHEGVTFPDADSLAGHKPAALTDLEVAKLAEEFAADDEGTSLDTEDGESVAVANVKDEKIVGTLKNTAPLVKNAEVPVMNVEATKPVAKAPSVGTSAPVTSAPRAEDRVPASVNPQKIAAKPAAKEASPMFTVQVGAYPTEAEAADMTQTLQRQGYKTSYVPANVNGKTWYRVSVGLFGTIKEAQDYKTEFLSKTKLGSAIVQRVSAQ
ncbi:SPOR domain-containing protein [Pseudobdellovibrio exovorus]|uniref:A rare lipoprotein A n=1 Tax=Pseudobdellovibrio exovorus JSS TaxID=1184267 RepID=M4V6I7_9BACT|nr:SPOR domain-containing protein [Pseudobdellovibrio exovorus]AGH94823.1 A rare lipoprotein A precursor [Pseudobdellovibrio exovorus JSS]